MVAGNEYALSKLLPPPADPTIGTTSDEMFAVVGGVGIFAVAVAVLVLRTRALRRSNAKQLIVAIYSEHNPDKLCDIDKLLDAYKGAEEQLIARLQEKYLQQ
jgi:hypothetical protein